MTESAPDVPADVRHRTPEETAQVYLSIRKDQSPKVPDDTIEWLARLLAGIYGKGWDYIRTAEQIAYRNDARAIARHLRARPADAAGLLGWALATEQETLYSGSDDLAGTPHVRQVIRGPWQVRP